MLERVLRNSHVQESQKITWTPDLPQLQITENHSVLKLFFCRHLTYFGDKQKTPLRSPTLVRRVLESRVNTVHWVGGDYLCFLVSRVLECDCSPPPPIPLQPRVPMCWSGICLLHRIFPDFSVSYPPQPLYTALQSSCGGAMSRYIAMSSISQAPLMALMFPINVQHLEESLNVIGPHAPG